ncbi:hypothetical protein Bbelb_211410 [Branchiostoma belcheri]|nr:hypothetical protein Bbelb_211410 [Branchiostoma belcheri]
MSSVKNTFWYEPIRSGDPSSAVTVHSRSARIAYRVTPPQAKPSRARADCHLPLLSQIKTNVSHVLERSVHSFFPNKQPNGRYAIFSNPTRRLPRPVRPPPLSIPGVSRDENNHPDHGNQSENTKLPRTAGVCYSTSHYGDRRLVQLISCEDEISRRISALLDWRHGANICQDWVNDDGRSGFRPHQVIFMDDVLWRP